MRIRLTPPDALSGARAVLRGKSRADSAPRTLERACKAATPHPEQGRQPAMMERSGYALKR